MMHAVYLQNQGNIMTYGVSLSIENYTQSLAYTNSVIYALLSNAWLKKNNVKFIKAACSVERVTI